MNLKNWCAAVPGRQAALATHLDKSPSAVSQAVTGAIPVPRGWYRGIVEFTGGVVGFDDLIPLPAEKERGMLALLHLIAILAACLAVEIGSYILAVGAVSATFFCGTRF